MDLLGPSLLPRLSFFPLNESTESGLKDTLQCTWNKLITANETPLRVAFVIHTLLCLLRLYSNKPAHSETIQILRRILNVRKACNADTKLASEEEMKIAFFYVWHRYQLVGTVGKSLSSYYLSDVPDNTIYCWLSIPTLSYLKQVEQDEKILLHVRLVKSDHTEYEALFFPK